MRISQILIKILDKIDKQRHWREKRRVPQERSRGDSAAAAFPVWVDLDNAGDSLAAFLYPTVIHYNGDGCKGAETKCCYDLSRFIPKQEFSKEKPQQEPRQGNHVGSQSVFEELPFREEYFNCIAWGSGPLQRHQRFPDIAALTAFCAGLRAFKADLDVPIVIRYDFSCFDHTLPPAS